MGSGGQKRLAEGSFGGAQKPEIRAPWLLLLPPGLQAALPSPSLPRSSTPVLWSRALQKGSEEAPPATPGAPGRASCTHTSTPLPAFVLHGSGQEGGSTGTEAGTRELFCECLQNR